MAKVKRRKAEPEQTAPVPSPPPGEAPVEVRVAWFLELRKKGICVREQNGEVWHQIAERLGLDGQVRTVCGAKIREPFANHHPGKARCQPCFQYGYVGDGGIGDGISNG